MLKIDRSFADGLADGNEDAAIVSAVISMGNALHVDVLAEGVETSEQARQLRALGGFLGSSPSQAGHETGPG